MDIPEGFAPKIENYNCVDCGEVLQSGRYLDSCKRCLGYFEYLYHAGYIDKAIEGYEKTGHRLMAFECSEILPNGHKVLVSDLVLPAPVFGAKSNNPLFSMFK